MVKRELCVRKSLILFLSLVFSTVSAYLVLSSPSGFADSDSILSDVSITIPVACTLTGNGMNTHTATLPNGVYSGGYNQDGHDYTNGIGTTTLKAVCNDNEGFSIYAVGYTGEVIGATNSNKLVGTAASDNSVIDTGTATGPVGNSDVSNWAMKLTATSGNYAPIIAGSSLDTEKQSGDPDFSGFTSVPLAYTRVAYRNSGTDSGTNPEGSTLTTTYAAYISKGQPADTYSGKVKYTLVHPSNHEAPIANPAVLDTGKVVNSKLKSLAATVVNGEETTITPEFNPSGSYD